MRHSPAAALLLITLTSPLLAQQEVELADGRKLPDWLHEKHDKNAGEGIQRVLHDPISDK